MRVAPAIHLSTETRAELQNLVRRRPTLVRVVERCHIVLLAAEGLQDKQIAERLSVAPQMASRWRNRFLAHGVAGLVKHAPRPGRTPTITAEKVSEIVAKTTQGAPVNATQWSRSRMAREAGISDSSVGRIWRAHGLKPHRIESFKIRMILNLLPSSKISSASISIHPSTRWVLSVDEKSQIQALDRTQPGLPIKKGRGQTMTHDYKRNGTTTLFAALNTANGEVYHLCQQRHRHQEWLMFLRMLDQTVAVGKQIHIICDNYSTHKHERVQPWLERHKRFHVHFTPTSASWLNMIERFFRDLTENRIRRGIFRDLEQLITAIGEYIDRHNESLKPFIWTAKAKDILEKVTRARTALNK